MPTRESLRKTLQRLRERRCAYSRGGHWFISVCDDPLRIYCVRCHATRG